MTKIKMNLRDPHVATHEAVFQRTAPHIFLSICSAGKMLSHVLQGGGRDRGRDRGGYRAV